MVVQLHQLPATLKQAASCLLSSKLQGLALCLNCVTVTQEGRSIGKSLEVHRWSQKERQNAAVLRSEVMCMEVQISAMQYGLMWLKSISQR